MKALCWTGGPKVLKTSVCREKAWGPFLEVANHQVVLCIGINIKLRIATSTSTIAQISGKGSTPAWRNWKLPKESLLAQGP